MKNLSIIMLHKHFIYALGWLFLLSLTQSCDDGKNIGEDLHPDDLGVKLLYVDTFTVAAETVLLDSFSTLNSTQLLVGSFTHPMLGKAKATPYMQFLPSSVSDTIIIVPTTALSNPVYDSLTVSLNFNYAYGDDALAKNNMRIYELAEEMDTLNNDYYYTESLAKGSLLALASPDFTAGANTTYTARVSDALGNELFSKLANGTITNRIAFAEEFYGVAIEADETVNGMYALNISTGRTFMRLHYHFINSESDTSYATLTLLPSIRFHNIETDRSGTPLEALSTTNPINAADLGYQGFVQAGTGVATRLIMPDLSEFNIKNKRIISRAQLFMTPTSGTLSAQEPAPSLLYFLENEASGRISTDSNGDNSFLTTITGSSLTLTYLPNGQSYPLLDVTAYAEKLANGDAENNGVTIFPAETGRTTLNTLQIGDGRFPSTPLQLRIYYTEFQ